MFILCCLLIFVYDKSEVTLDVSFRIVSTGLALEARDWDSKPCTLSWNGQISIEQNSVPWRLSSLETKGDLIKRTTSRFQSPILSEIDASHLALF